MLPEVRSERGYGYLFWETRTGNLVQEPWAYKAGRVTFPEESGAEGMSGELESGGHRKSYRAKADLLRARKALCGR